MPVKQRTGSTRRSRKGQTASLGAILLVALLVILYVVATRAPNQPSSPPAVETLPTQALPARPAATQPAAQSGAVPAIGNLPGWLNLYFTQPDPPDDLASGLDKKVVGVLNQASQSIDVASFDFNLPSVTNALVAAKKRGAQVRVVVDEENGAQILKANALTGQKDFSALKTLAGAGIKVVNGGRSNGLMHDKLIIVDGKTLFMGSWNMSYNDTFRNNNNLLQITDPDLIANYQAKFDELYVGQQFGTHAEVGAQKPRLNIDGVAVENFFSPVDGVMDKLIQAVQAANKSVHFMAFTYTDDGLAQAMIERAKAGLDVRGVIETRGASQGAFVPLYCAKLPVLEDGNKYTMHHKVIVLDGGTVITGSFNFTKSADEVNDDNVLIIHSPAVAALYEQEFQKVYGLGTTPDAGEITCPK